MPRGNRGSDGEMGVLLTCVAGDLRGIQTTSIELVIEEHASAGATLAVDVSELGADEVCEAHDPGRVATGNDQTLVAVNETDHSDLGTVAEQPVDIGEGVLTGVGVEQV